MIEKDTSGAKPRKVFNELPGTDEGKAALLEFELADLEFVEEQQTFDFGAEFKDAPPTAAMLPKTEVPAFDDIDDDQVVFLGDDDAQLDFEEAARALAAEEAAEAMASGRGSEHAVEGVVEDTSDQVAEASGPMTSGTMAVAHEVDGEPAMVLNETTLPRLKVSTNEELMAAIRAIPSKMAFKIGEVAEMVGVKQYVLRYWESEFDALKPRKSKNGQRVYARRDVETALMIRKLLYTDRFSIEGARSALRQLKGRVREEKDWNQVLNHQDRVRAGLRDLVAEIQKIRQTLG